MELHPHSTAASPGRHHAGLWAVTFAFLTVMAFSTVPTPLYAIYQERDGFSTVTITVIFAVYAVGVIVALFLAGHVSDWRGRRRTLVPAVLLSMASAVVFLLWRDVPGLMLGRVLSGLSVGVVTATATAFITELHLGERPGASPRRAQVFATTANLGGLGLGSLLSGVLAEWVGGPLSTPFLVFLVLLALAALGAALAPETVVRPAAPAPYRPQRVAVPREARGRFFGAATGAFVAFAAFGLFTSLAPAFLAGELGHSSRALAAVPAFSAFTASVAVQLAAWSWEPPRLLGTGMAALSAGMVAVVAATWWPSLPGFLAGGVVAGAGAGLLFKGGITTASLLAPPERRAEVLAGFFLAGYLGLTVPVVGLGVLDQLIDAKVALLAFAALLLAGVAVSARVLLGAPRGRLATVG